MEERGNWPKWGNFTSALCNQCSSQHTTNKQLCAPPPLVDVLAVFLGLVAARLRMEHVYYNLVRKLPEFMNVRGINEVLCTVDDDGNLQLTL
ncbi:hypothetical protein MHYP_G00152330 [Metynnis hypsauchen]